MLVRSWTGDLRYGGRSGSVAAMSPDGNYAVSAVGGSINLLDSKGDVIWTRNMPAPARAVAISRYGTIVVASDDSGNYNSWAKSGEFYGRTTDERAKELAISPGGDIIVATSEGGLRYFDGALNLLWADNKSGSLDEFIAISDDGTTVITAGGRRLASHTSIGKLNWMIDVTNVPIIDMATSGDCAAIVVGAQDNAITAVDRYGKSHWTFATGEQWPNAVGVSKDAAVIAAGTNDGTIYILDHGGQLLTKRKLDAAIQQRSLAVSRDGKRIAVADQYRLYGLALLGNTADEGIVTYTPTPLNPVSRLTYGTTIPTPSPMLTTSLPEETPVPVSTPTRKSAAGPLLAVLGIAGTVLILAKRDW
jgi:WD40 repeat protein